MLLAKGFGKIQAVVETDRIGNSSDGQVGVLQKITSLLHAKIRQIFLGRLADHVLEGSEQVASAQTHICGNILHGNGVGVIGAVDNLRVWIYQKGVTDRDTSSFSVALYEFLYFSCMIYLRSLSLDYIHYAYLFEPPYE